MNTRRPAVLGTIAVLTLALAACGASDDGRDDVASLSDTDSASDGTATTDPAGGTEDGTATDLSPEEAAIEFAACMREEGVDMPDPEFDEDGGVMFQQRVGVGADGPSLSDRQSMEDAFDACGHLMENAGLGPGNGGPDRAEMEDRVLEFTQCMRDEGVEMDDPDFESPDDAIDEPPEAGGGGPVIAGPFGTLDLADPDVAAAFEECQDIMGMPDTALPSAEGDDR